MAVRIMECHRGIVHPDHHDEVVRTDGCSHSWDVAEQSELDRPDQHGTGLARLAQSADRLGGASASSAFACPSQRGDRGVETDVGIPAGRAEVRHAGNERRPERRSGEYFDHRWLECSRAHDHREGIGVAVGPGTDIWNCHARKLGKM
jgi:hypothetical protein